MTLNIVFASKDKPLLSPVKVCKLQYLFVIHLNLLGMIALKISVIGMVAQEPSEKYTGCEKNENETWLRKALMYDSSNEVGL